MRTLQTASDSRECSPKEPSEAVGRECLDMQPMLLDCCHAVAIPASNSLCFLPGVEGQNGNK